MPLSRKEINSIRKYFNDKPVIRAFVFGSYDQVVEGSDIDILVDLDYSQHIGLNFIKYHYDLHDILKKKVDLVSSNALSPRIKSYIDLDKQLIYER